ncbi:hypothetical protein FA13DRAFT_1738666 [Coprinellus micaceus]|uniref:Uncharacterized protein n=1 Tax=Coprinellus micaceus TaxID=71717 RepID=A0A4Y7ST57_COPMI|nr:hypothetical protein FA13DRAFT_1738666 [Coprinellus micaceus]
MVRRAPLYKVHLDRPKRFRAGFEESGGSLEAPIHAIPEAEYFTPNNIWATHPTEEPRARTSNSWKETRNTTLNP